MLEAESGDLEKYRILEALNLTINISEDCNV